MGLFSEISLFLGSIAWLFDFSLDSFLPSRKILINAVKELRDKRNLYTQLQNINVQTTGVPITQDAESVRVLIESIKGMLPNYASTEVGNWDQVVGVGYSLVNSPVASSNVPIAWPLYLIMMPQGTSNTFHLHPIGQLDDLDNHILEKHRRNVIILVSCLLGLGFIAQIIIRFGWYLQ